MQSAGHSTSSPTIVSCAVLCCAEMQVADEMVTVHLAHNSLQMQTRPVQRSPEHAGVRKGRTSTWLLSACLFVCCLKRFAGPGGAVGVPFYEAASVVFHVARSLSICRQHGRTCD